jgi:hypothetical protein
MSRTCMVDNSYEEMLLCLNQTRVHCTLTEPHTHTELEAVMHKSVIIPPALGMQSMAHN